MSTGVHRAGLLTLVICLAACSSGGGKQSTPTAARTPTTPEANTTTVVSRRTLHELGTCPKNDTEASARGTEVKAGIKRPDTKLVPIAASNVRLCRYLGPLKGDLTLGASVTTRLERDTNNLHMAPLLGSCPEGVTYLLTFANETQHVAIADFCDATLTNGDLGVATTTQWRNELGSLMTMRPGPLPSVKPVVANPNGCPPEVQSGASGAPVGLSLSVLNPGVKGLDRRLVPVAASSVRLCAYDSSNGSLTGGAMLKHADARQFEQLTNRPPVVVGHPDGACFTTPSFFVLTFIGDKQRVSIAQTPCGLWTNGVVQAGATREWFKEVQRLTASGAAGPGSAVGTGPSHSTGSLG